LVRWVVWEERFFDARDVGWGPESGFDQSRAFVGWAWLAGPVIGSRSSGHWSAGSPADLNGRARPGRIEFGYLNQTVDQPGRDSDDRRHFFSLNIYF